jgi:hypothetical protein
MKKNLLIIGLFFALAIIIAPAVALANCQWADIDDCKNLGLGGSGWDQAGQNTFCDQSWRRGNKKCCCGPDGETVGCCLTSRFVPGGGGGGHTEYGGQLTNRQKCQDLRGEYFAGWTVSKAESEYRDTVCEADRGVCRWYLNANCSNIPEIDFGIFGLIRTGLVKALDQTWCRASEKPSGGTAVCCCSATVKQTPPNAGASTGTVSEVKLDYTGMTNPLRTVNVAEVIGRVIRAILAIIGSIFLMMVIYGGFTWMTAAGNDTKVAKGRSILIWAIIGIIVIFLAWMLVAVVFEAVGV